jgi:dihydroxyacid dehydratase/phosphogluconate dehydratase
VRNGDMIELDVPNRRLDLLVSADEIARRLASRPPRLLHHRRGYGWLFAQHILQADKGCDFDFLRAEALAPVS